MPEIALVDPSLIRTNDTLLLLQHTNHCLGIHSPLNDIALRVTLEGMTFYSLIPHL